MNRDALKSLKKSSILRLLSFYPPYFGAGVRVKRISHDFREIDVELGLHFWNRNYVGTQFGGSLYAMTDPFYMLMLIENLGRDYVVWDKSAQIRYLKPGRGKVYAQFRLSAEQVAALKNEIDKNGRAYPTFTVQIKDDAGEIIAEVDKLISCKRKDYVKSASPPAKL